MTKEISASRVVVTSFLVDVLDIALNLVVMIMTGSVVMLAELFQGVADMLSSSFLLVSLARPKREIYFWTLLSALCMLLLASSLSFYFGLQRLLNPEDVQDIFLAYTALAIAGLSNGYAFYISVKRLLKGRPPVKIFQIFATSSDLVTKNTFVLDLMGMSAALVGFVALILYQLSGENRFDALGAMGIGFVLALLSADLIVDIYRLRGKRR